MADSRSPIRVLIVDDHVMVRRGLSTFLRAFSEVTLAGEAGSGEEAARLSRDLRPDVILMDMMLPGMSGLEAIRVIRRAQPEAKILALTSFKDGELIRQALEAGAIGYLLKDISADELALAIRAAHRGRATLSPEATQALVQTANQPHAAGMDLTARERMVLGLMVEGLSNTQIAARLFVSPSTVKSHVSSILTKLGAATRTEAVTLALRQRLVS